MSEKTEMKIPNFLWPTKDPSECSLPLRPFITFLTWLLSLCLWKRLSLCLMDLTASSSQASKAAVTRAKKTHASLIAAIAWLTMSSGKSAGNPFAYTCGSSGAYPGGGGDSGFDLEGTGAGDGAESETGRS